MTWVSVPTMLPYNFNSVSNMSHPFSSSHYLIVSLSHCLIVSLFLAACDSGDIIEQATAKDNDGHTVKLTACVKGGSNLTDKYTLSLATFKSGDNYALTAYTIPTTVDGDTEVSIVAPNVGSDISTVELVITNRLRQRVVTLASIRMDDYADSSDTIRLDVGTVDVGMFNVIQHHVFNQSCIQCHGGNGGSGAAGLNLTEGLALTNLVDVASTRKEGVFRVVSGNATQSLLHQILAEGGEEILHYNHTEVLSSQFKNDVAAVRSFIDDWINKLKIEDK